MKNLTMKSKRSDILAAIEKAGVALANPENVNKENLLKILATATKEKAPETTDVVVEAEKAPEAEATTDVVVEETKATETKEAKARGTWATSKVVTIFEALDKITLPAGITVAKMRDGYVFKKSSRRVLECWKSGKTVRVCVAPTTASMLNTSAAIEVTTRHDSWKSARYACEIERVAFAIKCYLEKC